MLGCRAQMPSPRGEGGRRRRSDVVNAPGRQLVGEAFSPHQSASQTASPGRSIVVFGTAVPNPRFAPRFHSLTPSALCPLGTRSFPAPQGEANDCTSGSPIEGDSLKRAGGRCLTSGGLRCSPKQIKLAPCPFYGHGMGCRGSAPALQERNFENDDSLCSACPAPAGHSDHRA